MTTDATFYHLRLLVDTAVKKTQKTKKKTTKNPKNQTSKQKTQPKKQTNRITGTENYCVLM